MCPGNRDLPPAATELRRGGTAMNDLEPPPARLDELRVVLSDSGRSDNLVHIANIRRLMPDEDGSARGGQAVGDRR